MTATNEAIEWLNRLSGLGFGTLLGLILFGNFIGVWMWTKQHREILATRDAQLVKLEAEKDEWKQMALGLLTPLESINSKVKGRG